MIPLQHIHPMIVHFPIVFFISLAALDLIATFRGYNVTGRSALGNLSTGIAFLAGVSAVVAYMFGDMALEIAESTGFHSEIAEIHEGLGETTAVVFAVWAVIRLFLWYREVSLPAMARALLPLAELIGAVLVIVTAYYGGQLVFDLGVNVHHM